ncbi:MAG: OmpA/MotB domain protein [Planctomycetaceae bacterium]|nr:OmpA/MotB domain protein [Planctomycetaceae bacterium]
MPTFRVALICVLAGLTCGPIGCCCSGGGLFAGRNTRNNRLAQRRAWELYRQNQALQQQYGQNAGALGAETDQLKQQLGNLQTQNSQLQQELNGLKGDREDLAKRYQSLVELSKTGTNPLSAGATQQLTDLAKRYPGFEFDPKTGVSKFSDNVLFDLGSSDIRKDASPLLTDFARIMNEGTSQELNILVVGHTDDKPVVRASTKSKHVDNWGLSTNRANEVVRMLTHNGVKSARCGAAGYGSQQPLVPNTDATTRQKNRRVEIFVLAPNASIAGWDNGNSTN